MHDEIDGRLWIEHGPKLTESLSKAWDVIAVSLTRVHAEHFDAPWLREPTDTADCQCR